MDITVPTAARFGLPPMKSALRSSWQTMDIFRKNVDFIKMRNNSLLVFLAGLKGVDPKPPAPGRWRLERSTKDYAYAKVDQPKGTKVQFIAVPCANRALWP